MEPENDMIQYKINFRELIETILKGKVLIAVITIIAIIFSGIVSFFILKESYSSTAVLLANPINLNAASQDATSSNIVDYLTDLPDMTVATYIQQLRSQIVLKKTIEALDLKDTSGQFLSTTSLSGAISIKNIAGTNLIEITATNQNPDLAAQIANTLSQKFIDYVTETNRELVLQAAELIAEKLIIEEQDLQKKSAELALYWKENGNIDLQKDEIASLIEQLVTYQEDLRDIEILVSSDYATLKTLTAAVKTSISIDLSDFNLNVNLIDDSEEIVLDMSSDNLSEALMKIEIIKVQTRLVNNIHQKDALAKSIETMNSSLTEHQTLLTELEYKYSVLSRDMKLAEETYDAYQQRYKDTKLIASSDIGKNNIFITTEAITSTQPDSPNKSKNLAVAALFGIILGVLIVLFRDYWKKSKIY